MQYYDTLSQATNDLKQRGYTHDFNLADDCIECKALNAQYQPKEFTVEEYYRFEGDTNPGDMSVVYAIQSADGQKGLLVDAFGAYSGALSQALIAKLKLDPHSMKP